VFNIFTVGFGRFFKIEFFPSVYRFWKAAKDEGMNVLTLLLSQLDCKDSVHFSVSETTSQMTLDNNLLFIGDNAFTTQRAKAYCLAGLIG
jgi:hypothetical protein